MPNGEIVGLRISEGDAASNEGKTYQRYSLGGNWYTISAVDGSGVSVASYVLNNALEVCIPLPIELSSRISGLAIVAINLDDSLTILSSTVRISGSATNVCGNVSSVPATIAVGSTGSPVPLPTAVPEIEDETDPPDTGGVAPSSGALVWALMIGFVGAIAGLRGDALTAPEDQMSDPDAARGTNPTSPRTRLTRNTETYSSTG